jgi:hypothetical protein
MVGTLCFTSGSRDMITRRLELPARADGIIHWERLPTIQLSGRVKTNGIMTPDSKPFAIFDGSKWLLGTMGGMGVLNKLDSLTMKASLLVLNRANVKKNDVIVLSMRSALRKPFRSYDSQPPLLRVQSFGLRLGVLRSYLRRFACAPKRVVLVGMNPDLSVWVQTGVPFGEVKAVRDWLQLSGPSARPPLNIAPARARLGL